jgi:tetratricopeptide (TPR) repeat protein
MLPLVKGILVLTLSGAIVTAEVKVAAAQQQAPESTGVAAAAPSKLMEQISKYEKAARDGEATHVESGKMAKIYESLGSLYFDAGFYQKSEDAIQRAMADMQNGPQADLADELSQLAVVDMELKNGKQAERHELEAVRIREAVGDPVQLALVLSDLASIYDGETKFKKAAEYAEKAYGAIRDRADVDVDDGIAVRETLGFALTGAHECGHGVEVLQEALDLASRKYGDPSQPAGYAEYALGFGYWHCGEQDRAAVWLGRGTTDLKSTFGFQRSVYLNSMQQYARFLRETGQPEAAEAAEAAINEADALVDARSLTGMTEGFRSSGGK